MNLLAFLTIFNQSPPRPKIQTNCSKPGIK
jgi:hypothetical protein